MKRLQQNGSGRGYQAAGAGATGLLPQAVRFLGAGGLATACHYVLLVGLVELELLRPVAASCTGFALSAVLNYWLRRRFVFRSHVPHHRAAPRYLGAVTVGLLLNGAVMKLGLGILALPYAAAQIFATGVTLVSNFVVDRCWTFRDTFSPPLPVSPQPVSLMPGRLTGG